MHLLLKRKRGKPAAAGGDPVNIYIDTREKPHAIRLILAHFIREGWNIHRQALPEGDYALSLDALYVIDRKQNLSEVCNNLTWERGRFLRELQRAKDKGKKLCILVENCPGIQLLEDVKEWANPRQRDSPKGIAGEHLYKMMLVLQMQYGIEWRFYSGRNTGAEIARLLMENSTAKERNETDGSKEPEEQTRKAGV